MIGYSFLDSFSPSNNAFVVVTLKPFEDRTKAADSAQALIAKVFGEGQNLRGHRVADQPAAGSWPRDYRRF